MKMFEHFCLCLIGRSLRLSYIWQLWSCWLVFAFYSFMWMYSNGLDVWYQSILEPCLWNDRIYTSCTIFQMVLGCYYTFKHFCKLQNLLLVEWNLKQQLIWFVKTILKKLSIAYTSNLLNNLLVISWCTFD